MAKVRSKRGTKKPAAKKKKPGQVKTKDTAPWYPTAYYYIKADRGQAKGRTRHSPPGCKKVYRFIDPQPTYTAPYPPNVVCWKGIFFRVECHSRPGRTCKPPKAVTVTLNGVAMTDYECQE